MPTDAPRPCPSCGETGSHEPGCYRAGPSPWSIPIRDADPDLPQRYATWVDRTPASPLIFGVLVVFALVVGAALLFTRDTGTEDPEVLGSEVAGVGQDSDPADPETPSSAEATTTTEPATTTTTTTSATSSSTPTTSAPPTTMAPDPEPGDLPFVGPDGFGAGWIAQVSSVPSSAGGAALRTAYETVSADLSGAVVLRGGEWDALRSGYWVIAAVGFDDAGGALDACAAAGRTGRDDCFARYLAVGESADRVCFREEDGTTSGSC